MEACAYPGTLMHSYLGVTAHFISTGWDLQMYLLSCTQILGRHTASNITSEFQEVLIKYKIEDNIRSHYAQIMLQT